MAAFPSKNPLYPAACRATAIIRHIWPQSSRFCILRRDHSPARLGSSTPTRKSHVDNTGCNQAWGIECIEFRAEFRFTMETRSFVGVRFDGNEPRSGSELVGARAIAGRLEYFERRSVERGAATPRLPARLYRRLGTCRPLCAARCPLPVARCTTNVARRYALRIVAWRRPAELMRGARSEWMRFAEYLFSKVTKASTYCKAAYL